jgi:hypothetical protein
VLEVLGVRVGLALLSMVFDLAILQKLCQFGSRATEEISPRWLGSGSKGVLGGQVYSFCARKPTIRFQRKMLLFWYIKHYNTLVVPIKLGSLYL